MKCTCEIVYNPILHEVIQYCPTHKVAFDLLRAAKTMLEYLKYKETEGSMMPIARGKQKMLTVVIAKAEKVAPSMI